MPGGFRTPWTQHAFHGTLHYAGYSQAAIGRALLRHRSTISRELKRNSVGGEYAAHLAHEQAVLRRRNRPRVQKLDRPEMNTYVRHGLGRRWSPGQIAGRSRRDFPQDRWRQVSRMTIYRWIGCSEHRGHWESCLRFGRRRRKPERRGRLKAAAAISGCPGVVETRSRFGDWEGDTVLGTRRAGGIVTLTERKNGFAPAGLVRRVRSRNVSRAIRNLASELSEGLKHTLTLDNGKKFAGHRQFARSTGLAVYFARPYHAWERGSNEHFNGLLRQYFPKGTDFTRIRAGAVQSVLNQLNDRPRKRLSYRSPKEVLEQYFPVASEL